jgi:hypothetical protein
VVCTVENGVNKIGKKNVYYICIISSDFYMSEESDMDKTVEDEFEEDLDDNLSDETDEE